MSNEKDQFSVGENQTKNSQSKRVNEIKEKKNEEIIINAWKNSVAFPLFSSVTLLHTNPSINPMFALPIIFQNKMFLHSQHSGLIDMAKVQNRVFFYKKKSSGENQWPK